MTPTGFVFTQTWMPVFLQCATLPIAMNRLGDSS